MGEYNTRFENGKWVCDCPHFRYRNTDCRHILLKKLEQRGNTKGVRETSIDAYCELISDPSRLNNRYKDILMLLHNTDVSLTDCEIAKGLGFTDPNRVRPRRYELVNSFFLPFIQEGGKRVCSVSGKRVFTWELSRQGRLFVRDLLMLDNTDKVCKPVIVQSEDVWEPYRANVGMVHGARLQTTLFPEGE